jgi:hypothetical protein
MFALSGKFLRNLGCLTMVAMICASVRTAVAQSAASEKSPAPSPSARSGARGMPPSTLGNPPAERGGVRGTLPPEGKPDIRFLFENQLKIFTLRNSGVEPVVKMLAQLVNPDEIKIAAETSTNQIVASGSQESLAYLEAILMQIDDEYGIKMRDAIAIKRINIIWLAAGAPDANSSAPADDMKGVIEELGRLGMKNVRQIAQVEVRNQSNGSFKTTCMPLLESSPVFFDASGKISNQQILERENGQEKLFKFVNLKIRLSASKQRLPATQPISSIKTEAIDTATPNQDMLFDLGVEMDLQKSQYALLAVVPGGKNTFALVVKVDSEKL